jgi:hypothetical protein
MKNKYIAACIIGAAALQSELNVNANPIFNNARQTGNWWGYCIGMDFVVNSSVTVSALGTFDSNLTGLTDPVTTDQINNSLAQGISSGDAPIIQVGIFNVATGVEVSPTASFFYNDPNIDSYYAIAGSIFQNITPFNLDPGTYAIVAAGYNYLLSFGNIFEPLAPATPTFDDLDGALSLTGDARLNGNGFGTPALEFPTYYTTTEVNPDYLAGTFIAQGSVPDAASTLPLLGLAVVSAGALRRRLQR